MGFPNTGTPADFTRYTSDYARDAVGRAGHQFCGSGGNDSGGAVAQLFLANPLVAIRADLQRWKGPARMVWGLKDSLFGVKWAEWLDRMLPGSTGVRRVEGANLFFPEEMPELIAEEATRLWNISLRRRTESIR